MYRLVTGLFATNALLYLWASSIMDATARSDGPVQVAQANRASISTYKGLFPYVDVGC